MSSSLNKFFSSDVFIFNQLVAVTLDGFFVIKMISYCCLVQMLESAFSYLLEARCIDEAVGQLSEMKEKFWSQLQGLLKSMLSIAMSGHACKSTTGSTTSSNSKFDVGKLRELYRMSLKSSSLSQLHAMYVLWSS